jgi:hypothetical protein
MSVPVKNPYFYTLKKVTAHYSEMLAPTWQSKQRHTF